VAQFEILPRLTLIAGFEVGTGLLHQSDAAEESAKYLRELRCETRTHCAVRRLEGHALSWPPGERERTRRSASLHK